MSTYCMRYIFNCSLGFKKKKGSPSPAELLALASSQVVMNLGKGKKCSGQQKIHLWLGSGSLPVWGEGQGHRGLMSLSLCVLCALPVFSPSSPGWPFVFVFVFVVFLFFFFLKLNQSMTFKWRKTPQQGQKMKFTQLAQAPKKQTKAPLRNKKRTINKCHMPCETSAASAFS